jgi:hypothetical protein
LGWLWWTLALVPGLLATAAARWGADIEKDLLEV